MSKASLILRGAMMACALCTASLPALAATQPHQAKHTKAPARWYTGDSTRQQRTAILKKEINAAYAEQQSACRKQSASERASCLNDARQTYRNDIANVPQLLASAPRGSVSERVVSVTTQPATGGTTSYGASQGGSTGSGMGTGASPASGSMDSQQLQAMPQTQQQAMPQQQPLQQPQAPMQQQ